MVCNVFHGTSFLKIVFMFCCDYEDSIAGILQGTDLEVNGVPLYPTFREKNLEEPRTK